MASLITRPHKLHLTSNRLRPNFEAIFTDEFDVIFFNLPQIEFILLFQQPRKILSPFFTHSKPLTIGLLIKGFCLKTTIIWRDLAVRFHSSFGHLVFELKPLILPQVSGTC